MSEYPVNDESFDDYTIKSATKDKDGKWWTVSTTESTGFGIPEPVPIKPKSGMSVRLYRYGGCSIRGIFLDGRKVYYRTQAEQDNLDRLEAIEREKRDRAKFEQSRADHDRRIAALPKCFRQRIARFQYNNPDFRWQYESYELFCCEQAVVIAEQLETPDAIREFHGLKWDEQLKRCPGLSDGHSGNTFGFAVTLAYDYLTEKSNVINRHGALAPLVGSEQYGCIPRKAETTP